MKRIFGRKEAEELTVTARTVTDYHSALKAIEDEEKAIYIEGNAYDMLMEMVNKDASLCKWLKSLGSFYTGTNGLHMLFGTLSAAQPDGGLPDSESEGFYCFTREFAEKEYQNYKGRNNKNQNRFELLRIK